MEIRWKLGTWNEKLDFLGDINEMKNETGVAKDAEV